MPRTLTEGSIPIGLFRFALPILFANVLQSLNGSVELHLGGTLPRRGGAHRDLERQHVMFLLIGAAFGVALAATILIGQYIGANNLAETKRVVGTSATFFTGISVAMAVAGLVLCRPLLIAMSTPPDSLELAVAYMRVIFLALPFLYLYAFVMAVLRGAGDSKTPFYFMLLSVGIDIALNPLFIFGLGPVPRFGIAGLGARDLRRPGGEPHRAHPPPLPPPATYCACIGTSSHCSDSTGRSWRHSSGRAIPMSAQMLVMSLSGVLMITLVNRFGVDTTAAFGAALQIWNYIQMPAFAVGMALSAMTRAERRRRQVAARHAHRAHRRAAIACCSPARSRSRSSCSTPHVFGAVPAGGLRGLGRRHAT